MKLTLKKIVVIGVVLRLFFAFVVWHPDINNHIDWGIRFWGYGPSKFYHANVWSFTWPNQPPGTVYIFALVRKIYELIFSFFWSLNISISFFPSLIIPILEERLYPFLLQIPSILADIGILYLIYKILYRLRDKKTAIFGSMVFFLNPLFIYSSSVWGQTDSLINFFVLLSFYLVFAKKPTLAIIAFFVSIYIKISLLILLPIFLITLIGRVKLKNLLIGVSVSLFMAFILTLPFSSGNVFVYLTWIYQKKVLIDQLQIITANAFNLWAFVAGIHEKSHFLQLGPLTYQVWGYLLTAVFSIPIFIKLLKDRSEERVYISSAMFSFCIWMFMTNMHERYLYPFLVYFTLMLALNRKLLVWYLLIFCINLLNLYNFWWFPRVEILVNFLSFGDRIMPRILGLFTSFAFLKLYYLNLKSFFSVRGT